MTSEDIKHQLIIIIMNPWPRIALLLKPPLFDFGAGLDGMLPLWKLTCSTIWPVWMFVLLCHVTWRAEFKPAETLWSDELVFRAVDDLNETNICRAFCKFYTPVMGAHNGGVFISSVGITLSMCHFLFVCFGFGLNVFWTAETFAARLDMIKFHQGPKYLASHWNCYLFIASVAFEFKFWGRENITLLSWNLTAFATDNMLVLHDRVWCKKTAIDSCLQFLKSKKTMLLNSYQLRSGEITFLACPRQCFWRLVGNFLPSSAQHTLIWLC